ncbi:unnamed protein product [Onchocerca flexuosa]|uniref:4HBT domain-containing protein n=1 Tax=Onchocerca flexuosa TaxID=387005 RepID=A0A183HUJ7_9BILA|nr:unnamed protein product [Onchocerca flexuosa]
MVCQGIILGDKYGDKKLLLMEYYMLPVKLGEVIVIEAKVLKIGRNMAFAEAEFRRKSDGRLVAKGKHTIAFIPKPPAINGDSFEQF